MADRHRRIANEMMVFLDQLEQDEQTGITEIRKKGNKVSLFSKWRHRHIHRRRKGDNTQIQ